MVMMIIMDDSSCCDISIATRKSKLNRKNTCIRKKTYIKYIIEFVPFHVAECYMQNILGEYGAKNVIEFWRKGRKLIRINGMR